MKLSQTCPQLAAATTQAQQHILKEIEKRKEDIHSLKEQILRIMDQIGREGDEDRVLSNQMGDLSHMRGQHQKKIQELKETCVFD